MTNARIRTGRTLIAVTLAGAALGLGGCVTQQEYDKLWETNRSLLDRNGQLVIDLDNCRGQYNTATTQTTSVQTTASESLTGAQTQIGDLQASNAALRGQLTAANSTIMGMEDQLANMEIGRLDPSTDLALARLAAQYPGMIVYEADRGMLRFSSDLTFRSGSDEVQKGAKASLAALAGVLKGPDAAGYDIRIIGHTDSEKPSSRTRKRHPSNMHLSAHRAISVREVLGRDGVPWARMTAGGWGEHRPRVANTKTGNTPENRRVEIYLTQSSGGQSMGVSNGSVQPMTHIEPEPFRSDNDQPPARVFEPTK